MKDFWNVCCLISVNYLMLFTSGILKSFGNLTVTCKILLLFFDVTIYVIDASWDETFAPLAHPQVPSTVLKDCTCAEQRDELMFTESRMK